MFTVQKSNILKTRSVVKSTAGVNMFTVQKSNILKTRSVVKSSAGVNMFTVQKSNMVSDCRFGVSPVNYPDPKLSWSSKPDQ